MNKKTEAADKTKRKLKDAFLELYSSKRFTDITVGAVAKKAGVNRCTFYNYYDDLSVILAEIEGELLSEIKARAITALGNAFPDNLNEVFKQMLITFEEYSDRLYLLLGRNGDTAFRKQLMYEMKTQYRKLIRINLNDTQIDYMISFALSSGLGLVEHWYEMGKQPPLEEFLHFAQTLVAHGILGVMMSGMTFQNLSQ